MQMCHEPCPIGNQGWASPKVRKPCCRRLWHRGPHWNKLWKWADGEYPGDARLDWKPALTRKKLEAVNG